MREEKSVGYEKRIAVLKQISSGYSESGRPLAGIFKIENYAGRSTAEVSLLNARAGKFFAAIATGGGGSYRFPVENLLKTRAELPSAPDISEGAACLILEGADYRPVAFGSSGLVNVGIDEMRRTFVESILGEGAQVAAPPERTVCSDGERRAGRAACRGDAGGRDDARAGERERAGRPDALRKVEEELYKVYEDEVVAGENYYLNPDVDMETLSIKQPVAGSPAEEAIFERNGGDQDGGTARESVSQNDGYAAGEETFGNAPDVGAREASADGESGRYYDKVKSELEKVFLENPAEEILTKNVPDSRWAKVRYGEEKYYAVGVIGSGGAPAYICYGVPGKYQADPPKELKGYCSYLPLSLFDLTGEGYWMMYQDAETGECAHVDFV